MRLVLASNSKYRENLLKRLGLPFTSRSPDINEVALPNEGASDRATRLSITKAKTVAEHFPNCLIIGSDQVADCDGIQMDKPADYDHCVEQLRFLKGKSLTFYTGICLYNSDTNTLQNSCEVYTVHFRQYSDEELQNYIRLDQPYDCAGSFKVECTGIALFTHLHGDDPNTLIGLPLIRLIQFLANEGISVLGGSV